MTVSRDDIVSATRTTPRVDIYNAYVVTCNAAGIRPLSNTSFQNKLAIVDAMHDAARYIPASIPDVIATTDDAPDVTDIVPDDTMHAAPAFATTRLLSAPSAIVPCIPANVVTTFDQFDIGDTFGDIAAFVAANDATPPAPRSNTLAARELSGVCGYIHDKMTPRDRGRARRWWRRIHGAVDHTLFGRWATSTVPVELCNELGFACHPTPRA